MARGVPEVLCSAPHVRPSEGRGAIGAPVGRRVVDDDHLGLEPAQRVGQGGQTSLEPLGGVPRHDPDPDIRHGGERTEWARSVRRDAGTIPPSAPTCFSSSWIRRGRRVRALRRGAGRHAGGDSARIKRWLPAVRVRPRVWTVPSHASMLTGLLPRDVGPRSGPRGPARGAARHGVVGGPPRSPSASGGRDGTRPGSAPTTGSPSTAASPPGSTSGARSSEGVRTASTPPGWRSRLAWDVQGSTGPHRRRRGRGRDGPPRVDRRRTAPTLLLVREPHRVPFAVPAAPAPQRPLAAAAAPRGGGGPALPDLRRHPAGVCRRPRHPRRRARAHAPPVRRGRCG